MFGGLFGGGSKSAPENNSSTSNSSTQTSADYPSISSTIDLSNTASPSSASANSSSAIRARIENTVTTQSNIANARYLVSKINENCFDHCVTAPGSSLSSREEGCLSACIQKYIQAWNTTSRAYTSRLQKEAAQLQGAGIISPGGDGKELF